MPLFEDLFNHPRIKLSLYICFEALARWDQVPKKYKYDFKILRGIILRIPSKVLTFALNPSIILEIIRNNPDVIVICEMGNPTMQLAFFLGKFLRIPVILVTEATRFLHQKSIVAQIYAPLRKLVFGNVNAIVVAGSLSKEYAVKEGADSAKVFVAPVSIDNDFFVSLCAKYRKKKTTLKKELGISTEKVILYVGRIVEEKGVLVLLEAYRRLREDCKNFSLVYVGNGQMRTQLLAKCRTNRIPDVFIVESGLGFAGIVKYYSIADIFVLPTLLAESWGMVINEAMACSLPVIATNACGATADMILDGINGFAVQKGSVDELHLALQKLIFDERFMQSASSASLHLIQKRFNRMSQLNGFLAAIDFATSRASAH
jgi:glycosyltransferase involved in cell wall biosynthesis